MSNPSDIKYSREHRIPELMNSMVRHLLMYKPSEEHVHDALLNFLVLTQEEQRRKVEAQRRERQLRIEKASNDVTRRKKLEEDEELQRRARSQEARSRSQNTQQKNSKSLEQYQQRKLLQNQAPRVDPWKRGAAGLHRNRPSKDQSNPFNSAMPVPNDPVAIHKKLAPLRQRQSSPEKAGDPQLENAAVKLQALQRGRAGRLAAKNKQGQYPAPAEVQTMSFRAAIFGARELPELEVVDLSVVITVNGSVRKEVPITEGANTLSWNCEFAFHKVPSNAIVNLQLWNGRALVGRLRQLLGETRVTLPLGLSHGWRRLRYGRDGDAELELHVVPLRVVSEGEKEEIVVKMQAVQRMRQVDLRLGPAREQRVIRDQKEGALAVQSLLRQQGAGKLVERHKELKKRDNATLVLQCAARANSSKATINTALRTGAARRIQTGERKRRAVEDTHRRRSANALSDSVRRIQSNERQRQAKDDVEERRGRSLSPVQKEQTKAVKRLQSAERQRQAREDVEQRKGSADRNRAVRKLQSSERQRQAKDEVDERRRSRSNSPVHKSPAAQSGSGKNSPVQDDQDADDAVRRIQSSQRSRVAREDVERRRSTSPVQSAVRRIQSSERQRQARGDVEDRRSRSRSGSPVASQ